MKTPVVLLIFNRPDTTEKLFEAIRQAKPSMLLVVADGTRHDRPGDREQCAATRAIIERIDWDCKVLKNYSDVNLGCERRVSTGLDWVFNTVEEAIILEDDCLPNPTFFRFCEELLELYRYDSRIAVISGQNVQFGRKRIDYSYYFSCYNHCWGWATWRRAWQCFDFDMKLWPLVRDGNWLQDILGEDRAVKYWKQIFQLTYEGKRNSWATRWTFSCWVQSYLSILSNVNLISNIGFGREGTHTKKAKNKFACIPTEKIEFPLKAPPFVIRDRQADDFTQKTLYKQNIMNRAKIKIKFFLESSGLYKK